MNRNPAQLYILGILLLLYFWPWCFSQSNAGALATAVTLQLVAVIACDKLTSEPWVTAIIIIEALCMLFNVKLFLAPGLLADFHEQIMLSAFIIELLIITISMRGSAIGADIRLDGSSLRDLRRAALCRSRCLEAAQ